MMNSDMTTNMNTNTNLTTSNLNERDTLRSSAGIFAAVMMDHDHIKDLFQQFRTSVTDESRIPILNSIIRLLSKHAATEEIVLYPMFDKLGMKDLHNQATDEHQTVKELLDAIDGKKTLDEETQAKCLTMMTDVEQHAKKEETTMLPLLQQLPRDQLDTLLTQWNSTWAGAPTHPHPMAPNKGGLTEMAAGKMAAPMDACCDAGRTFVDDDYIKAKCKC